MKFSENDFDNLFFTAIMNLNEAIFTDLMQWV